MKLSEITGEDIREWLKLDEDADASKLEQLKEIATAYVCDYTSRTREYLDEHPDLIHPVMVLIQDMHDNRTLYVEYKRVNVVVQSVMDLHRKLEV